ncbi:hypothetical protein [Nocardioides pakistanensis]
MTNPTPFSDPQRTDASEDFDAVLDASAAEQAPLAVDAPTAAPLTEDHLADLESDAMPTTWRDFEYGPDLFGRGSAKLSDSAVAPIVAAARGYRSFDHNGIDTAFASYALPRKNTRQGRTLVDSMTRGDVLIMPWFTPDDVEFSDRRKTDAVPSTIQYRPSNPAVEVQPNGKTRELKYEFVSGQHSPIGMHPAIPTAWLDRVPRVLVAEGLLKGDAALTGMLLDAGYTREDLADLSGDPVTRLRTMLANVPEDKQVLILTIGGVWSWQKNPEWRGLPLAGREVWVGIDGDVSENPHVYLAATRLWEYIKDYQKAKPHLLAPAVTSGDQGQIEKIGIDDYLAKVGNWASLLGLLSADLPTPPSGNELDNVGKHRINDSGTAMEFCKPVEDAFSGETINGRWVEVFPLGGRVLSLVAERVPTGEEIETGRLDAGANGDGEWDVEIEVAWHSTKSSEVERHIITGPASILNYTPDQWDRKGAHIPAPILKHPKWPPKQKDGVSEAWLEAVKEHREDDTITRVRWGSMGWVPVDKGTPAFIIGSDVIGGDETDADILPGVGEGDVSGAMKFGVGKIDPRPFTDPAYQAEIRRDIEVVVDTYIRAGAWKDRRKAAVILASALRPCLPIRPQTVAYFTGPPGKGKSFAAAAVMGFWARRPGDWTGSSLPGSAKDTLASMELSVARTPIWVVDDLAPATSVRQSQQEQDRLNDVIRNVFNGSSKGRANADMGSRKRHLPRALLIVTAENEPNVASVRERVVTVDIGFGDLAQSRIPTDAVDDLHQVDGAPARVAQALIKYIRHLTTMHSSFGWSDLYQRFQHTHESSRKTAAHLFEATGKSGSKRAADIAGDLMVSLTWLAELAEAVECDDDLVELVGGDLGGDIVSLIADGARRNSETTPGKALLEAISGALRRGACHILNASDPTTPPGQKDGSTHLTAALGWQANANGEWRPLKDAIGYLVYDEDDNEVLLLDRRTAFNVAQQLYPDLVPPGQGQRSSWGSVIGEGLVAMEDKFRSGDDGKTINTARVWAGGVARSGVPVAVSTLFGRHESLDAA